MSVTLVWTKKDEGEGQGRLGQDGADLQVFGSESAREGIGVAGSGEPGFFFIYFIYCWRGSGWCPRVRGVTIPIQKAFFNSS